MSRTAPRLRVVVLLHERDRLWGRSPYLLDRLIRLWRDEGHEVAIARGPGELVPGDVLIPHLDTTTIPLAYQECYRDYPRVLNAAATDISKSSFSRLQLRRGDTWEGPVIVKSDQNYGGIPERRLGRRSIWKTVLPARYGGWVAKRIGHRGLSNAIWRRLRCLPTREYTVFSNLALVPPGVHDNPSLVVEKFVPERLGEHCRIRYYYFLNDRELNVTLTSTSEIIKGSVTFSIERAPVPRQLRMARSELGFDFGKIDYVLHDGEPFLLDVNWTPTVATLALHSLDRAALDHLAPGLSSESPGEAPG